MNVSCRFESTCLRILNVLYGLGNDSTLVEVNQLSNYCDLLNILFRPYSETPDLMSNSVSLQDELRIQNRMISKPLV